MSSNIFLYHERYAMVRELWDTSKNGDIDVVQPKKHDKVEYYWICPICKKNFKCRPLSISSMIDKGRVWCNDCIEGFNPARQGESFADYYPDLAKLWDYNKNGFITPNLIRFASNKDVWWVCPNCGKSYLRSPNSQRSSLTRGYCKDCSNAHKKFVYGSLGDLHPDFALMWSTKNKKSAYEVASSETVNKYIWKCNVCGYEWKSTIFNVINGKSRCQVCAGNKYKKGYTDLLKNYPEIGKVWDYNKNSVRPDEIFFRGVSNDSYWFKCPKCGISHYKTVGSFFRSGGKCTKCAIYDGSLRERGSLLDRRPDLAKQFNEDKNGIRVSEILANDTRQMWWLCDKGHSFKRSCHERIKSKGVCPICDGKEVVKGCNDFESCYPELLKYWCYDLNDCLPSEVAKNSGKVVWWVCSVCGDVYQYRVDDRTRSQGCYNCSIKGYYSNEEKELLSEIRSWGIYAEENVSIFEGSNKSVDIYIPYKNIAIEFNGLYWHSDEVVGRSYHYDKYNMCKDIGVQLIYVWEDDYISNRTLVLNMLKRKLGVSDEKRIGARNCQVKPIKYEDAKSFLEINHIQGSVQGTYYIGILYRDDLVGVGVFGTENGTDFTLKRYATNCILQGGFSKMLNYFRNNTWCWSIETFSDNGISDGNLYLENGFKVVDFIKYDYQYVVNSKRVHKFNYRKSRFKYDDNLIYSEGKTEVELADMNGLKRIWDAGKVKYRKQWFN